MKSVKVFLVCLIAILGLSTLAYAEVPKMINYQGKITTPQGALVSDTVPMTFCIYTDATGGSQLWCETQDSVKVEYGVFSVLLGSMSNIPDSVFNGNNRYLGLKVGDDSEMTPRKAIVSVGYAYHSGTADTAHFSMPDADWAIKGDTIYHLNGNVGIGTTSPNEQLEITGNLRLPSTTSTAGIIKVEGDRFIHSYGEGNTFIGKNAGNLTLTGNYNTANGSWALYSNTTGYSNTAVGQWALTSNTIGYYNTAMGRDALLNNTTGHENTATGQSALSSNTTGTNNTAVGLAALWSNTIGTNNTAVGQRALFNNTAGTNNTAIGYGADVSTDSLTNATTIGNGAVVDASNKVRIGNASVTVIEGQVNWSTPSDARLKSKVQESPLGLDFILKLKPVTYNSLAQGQEGITYTGLVAQEVERALQELGTDFSGLDKPKNLDGYYQLRYSEFVMPLIKAIQEQQEQIKVLQQRIEELEKK